MSGSDGYFTEALIRKRAETELRRRTAEKGETFDPGLLDSEGFKTWVAKRVESARENGALVSETQYADLTAGRTYRQGDRVRYVGPTRLEPSRSGANVTRPHGQTGTITKVVAGRTGPVYTFMPDIDKNTRAAADAGLDVEILTLETARWTDLERIVTE